MLSWLLFTVEQSITFSFFFTCQVVLLLIGYCAWIVYVVQFMPFIMIFHFSIKVRFHPYKIYFPVCFLWFNWPMISSLMASTPL